MQLYRPPAALNQVNDKDSQSDEQEDMDESSECVGRDHAQKPENAQNK